MADLHPTEHRGYRELHLSLKSLQQHWGRLAGCIEQGDCVDVLRFGAHRAGTLMRELRPVTESLNIYGGPQALAAGRLAAAIQNFVRDPFLEINQAVRFAILDAEHIANLLAYLAAAAEGRGDSDRAAFLIKWSGRFGDLREKLRESALAMIEDPEFCIRPVYRTLPGRVAQRFAVMLGNFGETADHHWKRRRA